MARRHWTLMVVPDDHAGVRQYRLSRRLLRGVVSVVAVVVVALSTLAAGFFVREDQRKEAERLTRTNELLVQEMAGIRQELSTLETALAELSNKDERYRLLANLEPLDDEVKLAGVGGPGSRTLEGNPLWNVDRDLAELTFGTSEDLSSLLRRAQVLATSWDEATNMVVAQNDRFERTPSIYPVQGEINKSMWRSSRFSSARRHPILNITRPHKGIDIVARRGTPVIAAAKGRVTYARDTRGDYGVMVEIDHGDGIVTRYAHLAQGSIVVPAGKDVERGQKIAEVGATGLVTNPSLHYEVLRNGRQQDPERFVIGPVLNF